MAYILMQSTSSGIIDIFEDLWQNVEENKKNIEEKISLLSEDLVDFLSELSSAKNTLAGVEESVARHL